MRTLKEGLKLAIKHKACKGNKEAFKKALAEKNKLECYQIAFGNYEWLVERGIISAGDVLELEKLSNGVGKCYYNNGQLYSLINYKNGKYHGLREMWEEDGQICFSVNYKNGKYDGLYELWYGNDQLNVRMNYKDGKLHGLYEEWDCSGQLLQSITYEHDEIVS